MVAPSTFPAAATGGPDTWLVYQPGASAVARIVEPRLAAFTERHKLVIAPAPAFYVISDIRREVAAAGPIAGVLLQLEHGIPSRHLLRLAGRLIAEGRRVALYWPAEDAVEIVDRLRLGSLWRHWAVYQVHRKFSERRARRAGASAGLSGGLRADDKAVAIAALRKSLDTVSSSSAAWRQGISGLEETARSLAASRKAVAGAKASGDMGALATGLEASREAVERLVPLVEGCRLAANRCGYSFDDLARTAGAAAIAGALDPDFLRGQKATALGAAEQLGNVAREIDANLAGFRSIASQAREAADAPKANGHHPAETGPVADGVMVLDNLSGVFADYVTTLSATAGEAMPRLAEAAAHVETRIGELTRPDVAATAVAAAAAVTVDSDAQLTTRLRSDLGAASRRVALVPFKLDRVPTPDAPLAGTGIYLRTDYWAPLLSGGSYGHTCYQARALARTSRDFVTVLANRFPLLDEIGLRQAVVRPEGLDGSEVSVLRAGERYSDMLRPAFDIVRPAYVFERACLGNFAAARICRELSIPYIVEYNGSEISMKRSFDKTPYRFEDIYLEAEDLAFRQASVISVVSDAVKDDVVKRGIDPAKVLVNWNAVDLDAYKALPPAERSALRAELGFSPADRVVCFIGTFGGWHGIDVLAAALPRILKDCPEAKVLLIGDGQLKPKVTEAIRAAGIEARVVDAGRVEQARGARLMAAADVFLSPHATHMVDSRFFGSPTKLFEYMGYGVGIVASDLEQIGEVMAPSIKATALAGVTGATNERGILCKPGDVDELVAAASRLVRDAGLSATLGANARRAAEAHYTWDGHVARLWRFIVDGRH